MSAKNPQPGPRKLEKVLLLFFLLVAVVLLFFGYRGRAQAQLQQQLREIIAARELLRAQLDADYLSLHRPPAPAWPRNPAPIFPAAGNLGALVARFERNKSPDRLDPAQTLEWQLSRGFFALAQGQLDQSPQISSVSTAFPGHLRLATHLLVGQSLQARKLFSDAAKEFQAALALDTNHVAALTHLADSLDAAGSKDLALREYARLIDLLLYQGDASLIQYREDEALQSYTRASVLAARLPEQFGQTSSPAALAHERSGIALFILGKWPETVAVFQEAIAADFSGASAARYHLHLGDAYLAQAKAADAIPFYEKALGIAGLDPLAEFLTRANLGNSLLILNQLTPALEHFNLAIAGLQEVVKSPAAQDRKVDLARVLNNRAMLFRAQRQLQPALDDLNQALILTGDRISNPAPPPLKPGLIPSAQLDVALAFGERTIDAVIRSRLAQENPERHRLAIAALVLKNRAYVQLATGQAPRAIADLKRAIEFYGLLVQRDGYGDLTADFVRSLTGLAWILATHPDDTIRASGDALPYAVLAAQLAGQSSLVAVETLAAAYAEKAKYSEAIQLQTAALKLPGVNQTNAQARLELYRNGRPFRSQRGG